MHLTDLTVDSFCKMEYTDKNRGSIRNIRLLPLIANSTVQVALRPKFRVAAWSQKALPYMGALRFFSHLKADFAREGKNGPFKENLYNSDYEAASETEPFFFMYGKGRGPSEGCLVPWIGPGMRI